MTTKKMYSYRHGIVDVHIDVNPPHFPNVYYDEEGYEQYTTNDGKLCLGDPFPILISLEEANKRGFVKRLEAEPLRVKFYCLTSKQYDLTVKEYKSERDFDEDPAFLIRKFVSFVDYKLNECDPPIDGWVENKEK